MDYQQAIDYLSSYTDYEVVPRLAHNAANYDLRRVEELLSRLGNPHLRARSVHIAGTNGKGSIAAMVASSLTASGYTAGLYTSPHLHTWRERISRELHDETIQSLVVLSRRLDTLASSGKGLSKDNSLLLEEVWQQTNTAMQGIRRLSQDLRPSVLDDLGLRPALEWLASDVAEYSDIATKVNVLGTERRFPEEVELVLFRVTQEALRNVWRHAQATQAEVTIEFDRGKVRITVSDNGKGFNLPNTIGDFARDGKLGLAGMQERARLVNGTLTMQSEPGKGTSIVVEIPA